MAQDKLPGVQIKQEQKEVTKETLPHDKWFAREADGFHAPVQITLRKKLKLQFSNKLHDISGYFQNAFIHEIETGLSFNLMPVFLGIGILIYFTVPAEPLFAVLLMTVLVLSVLIKKIELQNRFSYFLTIIAVIVSGMLAGQIATRLNHTPIIERQITIQLEGVVLGLDYSRRGAARYWVKPITLGDMKASTIPKRIRVSSAAKHKTLLPGETITGLVRLQPVSGPVYPGGYDFSFFSWHDQMGGSGFFMGRPSSDKTIHSLELGEQITVEINKIRIAIEDRIINAMPDTTGKIAVALVTGNKTRIPEGVQESLRKTGLAHILAISGLHMALVTLTVIWCVRFALVLVPGLALKYPIKKWAVSAGFISATGYLMLSGAGIATQRAWVMISVMLLAVLMDRRAITMRSVAISATIILLLNPQSLLSPGFQMSFAAVTALVAGYEFLNDRRRLKADDRFLSISQNIFVRGGNGLLIYFSGIATTSLIAGTATAFIAAWHFHQVAYLGLLANLIAMPIVSILIMPFVLFSILLIPYGLEFLPLTLVSSGIEWVVGISKWVEGLSPDGNTGLLPKSAMFIFAMFLISICLFKTRLRLFSFVPLLALPFTLNSPVTPDVIIAENGRAVAIKTKEQKLGLLYPRGSKFVQTIWLKAWSGGEAQALNLPREQCNRERCIVVLPSSKVLHIVYNPDMLQSSCNRADILVAPRLWWVNCKEREPELVLKRYDFERFGTHALYIKNVTTKASTDSKILNSKTSPTKIIVETALPEPSRPWHRRVTHPDDIKRY